MRAIKHLLKRALYAVAPERTTAILSARSRAHSHRLVKEWGACELNQKLIERFGPVVQGGPFRGMTLSPMTHAEHLGPFLLGTYEAELHEWLERIAGRRFAQVLDVGAKFGYYAVGLSRRMPGVPVIAFDTDPWARKATREMAVSNGTPDVTDSGFCSPRWLDRHLAADSFILSDCEGYEGELLARATTPTLATATLLIEIHDNLLPGVGATVRTRFAATHRVESVWTGNRPTGVAADLSFLSDAEAATAVREYRDPQEWLLFTPQAG